MKAAMQRLHQTSERGRGREAGRLRGLAYPFGLGAQGWVVGVVGRSIRKVDLHIIRHFFQEVGRHEAFLPIQFSLETKGGRRVSLLLPYGHPKRTYVTS